MGERKAKTRGENRVWLACQPGNPRLGCAPTEPGLTRRYKDTFMLVSPAFAQAAGAPTAGLLNSMLIPMILVFGIMWFFLIRPQQKKLKDDEKMRNALRRGDKVLTSGGIVGKVTKVKDDGEIEVEIAQNVKIHVVKGAITQVMSKTEPAEG
jgi:preprotein translocase subunit YajC